MLRNPLRSISVRLIGAYLFLGLLTLGLGVIGYFHIGSFVDTIVNDVTDQAEARYLGVKIRFEVSQVSNLVERYVTADSQDERQRLAMQLDIKPDILGSLADQIGRYGDSPQERVALSEIRPLIQDYLIQAQEVIDVYDAEEGSELQKESAVESFTATQARLQERLAGFEDQETTLLYESREAARNTVDQAQDVAAVLSAIALASSVLMGWWIARTITRPVNRLVQGAQRIAAGELEQPVEVRGGHELSLLAAAFNDMAIQLRQSFATLEQQVMSRTSEYERRSRYLQASAEVGRVVSSILDVDQLMRQVVGLIRERFDLYYVGLFQVDEANEWAILRAGTGEAGQTMLARGHRIRVGEGMIGWSVVNAQPRIALEAGEDAVRLATAELPETRSEAALPLRSRGRVLGALSVQSAQPGAFDQDTITVLQTMADQVAVALDNARLFVESQELLESMQKAYGELSRSAWRDLLRARPELGHRYDPHDFLASEQGWRQESKLAVQRGETVLSSQSDGPGEHDVTLAAVPLKVRDQVIGVLNAHKAVAKGVWSEEEIGLLESLADQLSVALESARLHQDARRRAADRQLVGEVTAHMRETLDMETVLKTAAQEVRQVLGLPEVVIRLTQSITDPEYGVKEE